MNIWWCEEHESSQLDPGRCWRGEYTSIDGPPLCRMVELQLVPLDALVIERDSGWPSWLTEIIREWGLEPSMFLEDLEDAFVESRQQELEALAVSEHSEAG